MAISCFFCENLLSDYIENVLPLERKNEIIEHLESCDKCKKLHSSLSKGISFLNSLPKNTVSEELALELADIIDSRNVFWSNRRIATLVLFIAILFLSFLGIIIIYPNTFPKITRHFLNRPSEKFVRYYPLLNGANSVIDEQAHWLSSTELTKTFLDEGGFSASEFEKMFLTKPEEGDSVE